jgi:hypothetical protein
MANEAQGTIKRGGLVVMVLCQSMQHCLADDAGTFRQAEARAKRHTQETGHDCTAEQYRRFYVAE